MKLKTQTLTALPVILASLALATPSLAATINVPVTVSGTNGTSDPTFPSGVGGDGQSINLNNVVPSFVYGVLGGPGVGDSLYAQQTANGGAGGSAYYGGTGGAGGHATSIQNFSDTNAASVYATTQATAGSGGDVLYGDHYSGAPGVGGAGGNATAQSHVTANGYLSQNVSAQGGNGGSGSAWGGSYNGSGSNGGSASADGSGIVTGNNYVDVSVTASGGSGGNSGGTGTVGSAGSASVSAYGQSDAGNVNVSGRAIGGNGGSAYGALVNGSDGADVTLTNAVGGQTSGSMSLYQTAQGGSGGLSNSGGAGGRGGAANSVLNFADTAAAYLWSSTTAVAGNGGDSQYGDYYSSGVPGAGGDGGDAAAQSHISGVGYLSQTVSAQGGSGGWGGYNYYDSNGTGGAGGAASADGSAITTGSNNANVSVTASGGAGGSTSGDGQAGAGGSANLVAYGQSDTGYVSVYGYAYGGRGGHAYGSPVSSGVAGDGANIALNNAVSGSTAGQLNLSQQAYGGQGGNTQGENDSGKGGNAESILNITDSLASYLYGNAYATGGTGGTSYNAISGAGGLGGNALAHASLASTVNGTQVSAYANAHGGMGGYSYGSNLYSAAGSATANAYASSVNAGAYADAYGATSAGASSSVHAKSSTTDGAGNTVVVNAITSNTTGGNSAHTYSNANAWPPSAYNYYGPSTTWSQGNVYSPANRPVVSSLGGATADFSILGEGALGAAGSYNDPASNVYSYTMSGKFSFSLASGNDLLFQKTGSYLLGDGFQTATLSLFLNGSQAYSHLFTSVADLEAALANPISFGAVSGGTQNVEVILAETIANMSDGNFNAYSLSYVFASALSGTVQGPYTVASAVPLPAALPLFAAGLLGCGGFAMRRKKKA